jgi:hypothetical protein
MQMIANKKINSPITISTWNIDGIELTSASTSMVKPSNRDSKRNGRSALNALNAFTDDK